MALFPLSKIESSGAKKKPFSLFKWAGARYLRGGVWGIKKTAKGVAKTSNRARSVARVLSSVKIVASDKRPR